MNTAFIEPSPLATRCLFQICPGEAERVFSVSGNSQHVANILWSYAALSVPLNGLLFDRAEELTAEFLPVELVSVDSWCAVGAHEHFFFQV